MFSDVPAPSGSRSGRSLVVAPLRAHGRALGVLHMATWEPGFEEEDLHLIGRIARQVAIAIEHVRCDARRCRGEGA